jgi:hypothetical protein
MKQIRQIGGRKGAQHAGYRKVLHGFARIEVTDAAVRPGSSETLVLQTNRERLQYLTSNLPWNLHHGPQGRAVRDSAGDWWRVAFLLKHDVVGRCTGSKPERTPGRLSTPVPKLRAVDVSWLPFLGPKQTSRSPSSTSSRRPRGRPPFLFDQRPERLCVATFNGCFILWFQAPCPQLLGQ